MNLIQMSFKSVFIDLRLYVLHFIL